MPRRPRSYRYNDDNWYSQRRQKSGFWYRLKRFLLNVGILLLSLFGGGLLVELVYLAFTYQAYLETILLVILGIAAFVLALVLLKYLIGIITTIVDAISAMRVRAIEAGKAKLELSRRN